MRELSLFSGAGGGLLATQHLLGWTTVGYVDNDEYCQRVLAQRIEDGHLDRAPIFGDIDDFLESGAAREYRGFVDVVTGGFPCQPFSLAGDQRGPGDPRNKWPATFEVIRGVEPEWVFLENVPGLRSRRHDYFAQILQDLAESGFDVRWDCVPARAVGAPHQRDRLWIVGHSNRNGQSTLPLNDEASWVQGDGFTYPSGQGLEGWQDSKASREALSFSGGISWWEVEPGVDRVADGVASWVDRIRASGNGQVPAVARAAWDILTAV